MFSPRSQTLARPFTCVPFSDEDRRNSEEKVDVQPNEEKMKNKDPHSNHIRHTHDVPGSG